MDSRELLRASHQIERIYTSVREKSFTKRVKVFSILLYAFGIALVVVIGMATRRKDELLLAVQLGGSMVCFIVAIFLMSKARKVGEASQMYGFAVVDVVDKDYLGLIRKNIYLIVSRVDLSGKGPKVGFHLTEIGKAMAEAERERVLKKERGAIQEMMTSKAFSEMLEKKAKDKIIVDDYWYVTLMRDARVQRNGFWGSTIKYRDAKGVFQKVFLSRDVEEYKELKNIINEWGTKEEV